MTNPLAIHFKTWPGRSLLPAVVLGLLALPALSGCAFFVQGMKGIGETKPAVYKGLAGQSVAVVVWADDTGTRIDWPKITLDISSMIEAKLMKSQRDDKPRELEKSTFPLSAASVVQLQDEHPEWASDGMDEIAPRLGVSRVIYVEIHSFQTREDSAVELYRGTITASVNVIEIRDGHGKIAFTDDTFKVSYPRTSPSEGLPNIGDRPIYEGTLEGFSTEVTKLFVPHGDDSDSEYVNESAAAKSDN